MGTRDRRTSQWTPDSQVRNYRRQRPSRNGGTHPHQSPTGEDGRTVTTQSRAADARRVAQRPQQGGRVSRQTGVSEEWYWQKGRTPMSDEPTRRNPMPQDADTDDESYVSDEEEFAETSDTEETEAENEFDDGEFEDDDLPSGTGRSFVDEMAEEGSAAYDDYDDMMTYEELASQNDRLMRQLEHTIEQYERLKEEWAKYRKRTAAELERYKALASERVATQIIPVIDDIQRSIEHIRMMDESMIPIADGNEAIANRIIAALEKEGVSVIDPEGEPFDATRHQAIELSKQEGMQAGMVYRTYQNGYAIGDRVIRPAMVGVTK